MGISGCAIHNPHEVHRYWLDFNTERKGNAQIESFHHLPPKPVAVKMMRWGYNVGPANCSNVGTLGWGTRTNEFPEGEAVPYGDGPWMETPQGTIPPLSPGEQLPVPPPAPPVNDLLGSRATSPSRERGVSVVGYQRPAAAGPATARSPAENPAWLFATPLKPRSVRRP